MVMTIEHKEYSQAENNEPKDKEEPEEILHIEMSQGQVIDIMTFNPYSL